MKVVCVKTHKITPKDKNILDILDRYIKKLGENSVVVIASKIISITEGSVVKLSKDQLDSLIKKEADRYIDKEFHKYELYITIKNHHLTYSSGVDESNGDGYQVLWPKNAQKTANTIRTFLRKKFGLRNLGVIITDMTALPLRWGIIAGEIAHSGFNPLKDLTGTPDIFGRNFKYTKVGILNGLAAAAGVVMGEGAEQTPIGVITDIPFVEFTDRNPSFKELRSLIIDPENDLYGPLFKSASWKKGRK